MTDRCHFRMVRGNWLLSIVSWSLSLIAANFISLAAQAQYPGASTSLPPVRTLYRDDMPPGVIGRTQVERAALLRGYFQPIEVRGPQGIQVALADGGTFLPNQPAPFRAALLVGSVYRLRISGIPNEPGRELYPTLEVIDRLYPPSEREHRFPIPIVLDEADIEDALNGDLITRIIYLEDSEIALPVNDLPPLQRVIDVSKQDDALRVADQLGRPMAILRIGSRVPDATMDMNDFLYGCPPWIPIKEIPDRNKLIESGQWPTTETSASVPILRIAPNGKGPRRSTDDSGPTVREAQIGRRIGG